MKVNYVVNDINRIVYSVNRIVRATKTWWSDKSASKKIILFYAGASLYSQDSVTLHHLPLLLSKCTTSLNYPPAWGIDHFDKHVASGGEGRGGGGREAYFNDKTYSWSMIIKWNKVFRLCSEEDWNLRTMRNSLRKKQHVEMNFFGPQAKTWSTSSRRRKGIF